MSLLEVSVQAGDLGPVIVLAGDADGSSVTQLNEALTAQVSGRTTHLTIDATRSSAGYAAMTPAWITRRFHQSSSRSADPTCSAPPSPRSLSTTSCTTEPNNRYPVAPDRSGPGTKSSR